MSLKLADAETDTLGCAEEDTFLCTEPPTLVRALASRQFEAEQESETAAARSIGVAVLLSVPFWLLFAFAYYLMH